MKCEDVCRALGSAQHRVMPISEQWLFLWSFSFRYTFTRGSVVTYTGRMTSASSKGTAHGHVEWVAPRVLVQSDKVRVLFLGPEGTTGYPILSNTAGLVGVIPVGTGVCCIFHTSVRPGVPEKVKLRNWSGLAAWSLFPRNHQLKTGAQTLML